MTYSSDEAVNKIIERIGDRELTPEVVLEASTDLMREDAYLRYPTARPEVVEALLLLFQHFYWDVCKEIDESGDWTDPDNERLFAETRRIGRAINATLKSMNS